MTSLIFTFENDPKPVLNCSFLKSSLHGRKATGGFCVRLQVVRAGAVLCAPSTDPWAGSWRSHSTAAPLGRGQSVALLERERERSKLALSGTSLLKTVPQMLIICVQKFFLKCLKT